jgi:LysR family glycine cleavage system transcriptional activator
MAAHPEVTVELVTIDADFTAAHKDPVRWDPAALDLVLTWGHGGWRGLSVLTLAMEELVPVAAPALAGGQVPMEARSVMALPRIEHTTRAGAWAGWAQAQGLGAELRAAMARPPKLRLEHFFMVMEAAKAGLGAGLLPRLIVAAELAAGTLVELSPGAGWKTGATYALVASEAALSRPAVAALGDYLVASAGA